MHFCRYTRRDRSFGGEFFFSFVDTQSKWYSLLLSLPTPPLNLCFFASLVRWGGGGGRERQQWRTGGPRRCRAVLCGPESAAPPPVPPPVPAALPALPRGTDLWPPLPGLPPSQQNAGKPAPGTSLGSPHPSVLPLPPLPPPLPIPAAGNQTLLLASRCWHYLIQAD